MRRGIKLKVGLGVWLAFLLVPFAGLGSEMRGAKLVGPVGARAVGTVVGWGDFEVDNLPAPPGTALFPSDVITTGAQSGAIVRLLAGDTVTVAEKSEVAVLARRPDSTAGTAPALDLRRGGLLVRGPAGPAGLTGKGSEISVPGAILTLNGSPAVCRIAAVGRSSAVVAEKGRVMIQGAGAMTGTATGTAPGTAAAAGRVTQLFPVETVEHAGSRVALPLRLNELVSQGDRFSTSPSGRVRIELLDGSFVAAGGGTSMQLIRHDPDTQQTQIELQFGRIRGEAVRPARPASSFEVRTATAVVKGSATTFVVDAGAKINAKVTTVCNAGDGPLSVASISPSPGGAGGAVSLRRGECSSWRRDHAPGAPQQAKADLDREMALTSFAGVPTIERTAKIVAIHTATTSTVALAAVLAGVSYGLVDSAVNLINDTSSNLLNAGGQFGAAAAAANGAAATANTAAGISAAVCVTIQATAIFDGLPVSPSGPGSFNCPR